MLQSRRFLNNQNVNQKLDFLSSHLKSKIVHLYKEKELIFLYSNNLKHHQSKFSMSDLMVSRRN